jgi:hypothetical protein
MNAQELRDYFLQANASKIKRIPCPVCKGAAQCPVCLGSRMVAREGVPYALARFEAAENVSVDDPDIRSRALDDACAKVNGKHRTARPTQSARFRQGFDDARAAEELAETVAVVAKVKQAMPKPTPFASLVSDLDF